MAEPAVWLTEADVVASMDLSQAIDALEGGLRLQARGAAGNMGKTHATWGDGNTLHAVGATFEGAGYVGTKSWAHTEGGAAPLLILWDAGTGGLKAIVEAFALGQMRTGAVSGVATRWMAAPRAASLAMIGTGKQALTQVAAMAAVRPLEVIRVFSPTAEKREAFARKIAAQGFAPKIAAASSLAEAVADAQIVTLATRARSPFLFAGMVPPGAHVNAIGAITPERAELDRSVFERASLLAADDVDACRRLSREFQDYLGDDDTHWRNVRTLSEIVEGGKVRPAGAELSIFKAMGMGVSDLSLGIRILKTAREMGLGRPIDAPKRAQPRLWGENRGQMK